MNAYRSGSIQWPVGTTNGKPFALNGDKGVNLWADMSIANGGSLTVKLQKQSPGGVWSDVVGAVTTALAAVGALGFRVYPGLTPAANQAVNEVLGGGAYRVVATVTGGAPTAQVVVEGLD